MKRIKEIIKVLFLVYFIGFFLEIIFLPLIITRRIKVLNKKVISRIGEDNKGTIIISNHPSLLEPILLPLIFFKRFFRHPIKLSPWSTPDRKNFFDKLIFSPLRVRSVPIERGNARKGMKALLKIRDIINNGGVVIIFPEGGRTFKGESFFYSRNGKRMRSLKGGIGWLALKTKASILPVWVDNTDYFLPNRKTWPRFRKKIVINIGEPFILQNIEKEEAIQKIATSILDLANYEE